MNKMNSKIIVLILILIIAGAGVGYWQLNQTDYENGQVCTRDAKQCPDGSYVGRTGPNCEFTVCPKTTGMGILMGKVSIGPNCPVEREGMPCTPSPEAYTSREFIVFNSNQKEVTRFHADASGSYSISLLPGTYTVVLAKTGIGFMSKDLPATVVIKAGQSATLNIDIDTGIR